MKKIFTILFAFIVHGAIGQCPDLKISGANLISLKPDKIRYTLNLANSGNTAANLGGATTADHDNVIITPYLSLDNILSETDKKLNDIALGHSPLIELKPGEVFTITQQDSNATVGYNYLILIIDPTRKLEECSETNNSYVLFINQKNLKLIIPSMEDPKGSTLAIPVYASDFYKILGFQFSISAIENNVLRIDSVGTLGLNEWSKNDIRIFSKSRLAAIWFSPDPEGLSFEGTRQILTIYTTITGEPGACTNLFFDNSVLPKEFISSNPLSDPITPEIQHGKICVQQLVECSGKITLSNSIPLPRVTVKANQIVTTTDATGNYKFISLAPAISYIVSANKTDSYAAGLSVIDIVLIKRHLLQIQLLPTPYEIIAADVNGDLVVSVQDIVLIRSLILGIIPDFGKTPVWQFIPKEYKFKNPLDPLKEDYPIAYTLNNLSANKINVDFIGIKTGDVSLDAVNGLNSLESRSSATLKLKTEDKVFNAGTKQSMKIDLDQEDIEGLQVFFKLNPAVVIESVSTSGMDGFSNVNYTISDASLKLLWHQNGKVKPGKKSIIIHFTTSKTLDAHDVLKADDDSEMRSIAISSTDLIYQVDSKYSYSIERSNHNNIHLTMIVYPNPIVNSVNLQINSPTIGNGRITITDVQGKPAIQQNVSLIKGDQLLKIEHLRLLPGNYQITLTNGSYIVTKKLMVL